MWWLIGARSNRSGDPIGEPWSEKHGKSTKSSYGSGPRRARRAPGVAKRHTSCYTARLKYFTWDREKNEKLKAQRGVSFDEVVFHIERGDILDILEHPNQERYEGQRVFVVQLEDYVYLVPFVEEDERIVLKTIIPSRKATRKYLRRETQDHEA